MFWHSGQSVRALESGFEPRPRQLLCRDVDQILHLQLFRANDALSCVVCISE